MVNLTGSPSPVRGFEGRFRTVATVLYTPPLLAEPGRAWVKNFARRFCGFNCGFANSPTAHEDKRVPVLVTGTTMELNLTWPTSTESASAQKVPR
jgi:hypothetical protein